MLQQLFQNKLDVLRTTNLIYYTYLHNGDGAGTLAVENDQGVSTIKLYIQLTAQTLLLDWINDYSLQMLEMSEHSAPYPKDTML